MKIVKYPLFQQTRKEVGLMLGTDSRLVSGIVTFLVQSVKIIGYVGGILALLLVDIFFGAAYYAMAFGGAKGQSADVAMQLPFLNSPLSAASFGLFFSLVTTALQIIFWTLLVRKGSVKEAMRDPASLFGFVCFAGIMILDTMADLGAVTHMVYPETARLAVLPTVPGAASATGFVIVAIMTVMMTAVNEPMLKMIMDKQKAGKTDLAFA